MTKIKCEKDLDSLSNEDLLELYVLLVKVAHYDPMQTPVQATELWSAGINKDMLGEKVLNRMNSFCTA